MKRTPFGSETQTGSARYINDTWYTPGMQELYLPLNNKGHQAFIVAVETKERDLKRKLTMSELKAAVEAARHAE